MTVTLALPLFVPQEAAVDEVVAFSAPGFVMVTELIAVHPVASVTLTIYVPADKPVIAVTPDELLLQLYVSAPDPPDTDTTADPLVLPLHKGEVPFRLLIVGEGLLLTEATAVVVQLFPSITVTVYVPAVNPETV